MCTQSLRRTELPLTLADRLFPFPALSGVSAGSTDIGVGCIGDQQRERIERDCEAQTSSSEHRLSPERVDGAPRERERDPDIREGSALSAVRVRRQGSNHQQGQLTLGALLAESEVLTGAEAEKAQLQLRQRAGAFASLWAWAAGHVLGQGTTTGGGVRGGQGGGGGGSLTWRQGSLPRDPPQQTVVAKRAIATAGVLDPAASPRMQRIG